jgi:iron complex transport system ATP-binding protein
MIELNQVCFTREENRILTRIDWKVKRGEHWALLGRNGSGKTTLLEIINGYEFPSSGQVQVLGEIYGQVDLREVRQRIGYISQSLFEKLTPRDPLWEVVATGAYAHLRFYNEIEPSIKATAIERLHQFGLAHLQHHPLGTLSQGERKKALLARALMGNPELIVLDEPCSGLDMYQRENFLQAVEAMAQEATMIYVTHHLEELVPAITHVALLKNGEFTASGSKQEVLTKERIEAAYDVRVELHWEADRPWVRVIKWIK